METAILPLSGRRRTETQFWLPPPGEVPSDFGAETYDLRRLLLGKHGYEAEVGEEIRRSVPDLKARGQFVPWQVFTRGLSTRDVTAGGATTGSSLIQVERLEDIASALVPVSQVIASGATVLTDLTNNISWPRWQLPFTPSAVTEIGTITSSGQSSSLMSLSAHRVSSMTVVSKQLLTQGANLGLERLIKKEMLRAIGSVIDGYCLTGTGVSPYPLGILAMPKNTAGQRDVAKLQPAIAFGGATTFAEIVSFVTALESTDVENDGTFGWVVSPATKGKWSTAPKVATFPSYLYQDGETAGYPLRATNNLSPTNQVVFARWSDVVIGLWPLSLMTDPYTLGTTANVRIFADVFCDVGVLRGPAVAISSDSGAQ